MLITDVASAKEQEGKDTKVRKEGHGAFYMLPHYMKLYDILKGAYANYKVCHRVCSIGAVLLTLYITYLQNINLIMLPAA